MIKVFDNVNDTLWESFTASQTLAPTMRHRRQEFHIEDDSQDEADGNPASDEPVVRRESWCSSISTLLLVIISFTSILDLVLSWSASAYCTFNAFAHIGEGDTDTPMAILGAVRIVHIVIVYGSWATFVPKRELSGPGRRAKMHTQGGHSLMLTYFLGCGAVAEFVRDRCCKEIPGILRGRER